MNNIAALKETVADIALTAGFMLAEGSIQVDDSRKLTSDIVAWAEEFVTKHEQADWDTEDYISNVDQFSVEKLIINYGSD